MLFKVGSEGWGRADLGERAGCGVPRCGDSICGDRGAGKGGWYFRHKAGSVTLVQRFKREYSGDTRELAWGWVFPGLAGVWILDEEQIYFRHGGCCLLLFFLLFSFTPGSSFPVQASFQKPSVGRCAAGVCSQLGPGPCSDLPDSPGRLSSTSWWGRGWGTICWSLLSVTPLSGPRPLL